MEKKNSFKETIVFFFIDIFLLTFFVFLVWCFFNTKAGAWLAAWTYYYQWKFLVWLDFFPFYFLDSFYTLVNLFYDTLVKILPFCEESNLCYSCVLFYCFFMLLFFFLLFILIFSGFLTMLWSWFDDFLYWLFK